MIRNSIAFATILIPAFALTACADTETDDNAAELEVATTDGEADALAKALEAGDFADLELGAKIVGPQGPEVKTSLTNEAGVLADITSYVACPAGMDKCDPATAPEGTLYTYVHTVFPGSDNDPLTGAGDDSKVIRVESASAFLMNAAAHGFMGHVGFSKDEAIAAAGDTVEVIITCGENDGLAWTVNSGDGGDQWENAEPMTFYWQSYLPPAGPAPSYELIAEGFSASGNGPYPAANPDVANFCTSKNPADNPQPTS